MREEAWREGRRRRWDALHSQPVVFRFIANSLLFYQNTLYSNLILSCLLHRFSKLLFPTNNCIQCITFSQILYSTHFFKALNPVATPTILYIIMFQKHSLAIYQPLSSLLLHIITKLVLETTFAFREEPLPQPPLIFLTMQISFFIIFFILSLPTSLSIRCCYLKSAPYVYEDLTQVIYSSFIKQGYIQLYISQLTKHPN